MEKFIIGDVHGNYEGLKKSLKKANVKTSDELYFLGDMINKGENSLGVINFISKWPNAKVLFGNHEHVFIEYHLNDKKYLKDSLSQIGGKWSLQHSKGEMINIAKYLNSICEYYLEINIKDKKIGLVHANVPNDDWNEVIKNSNYYKDEILFSFDRYNNFKEKNISNKIVNIDGVVLGHTPVPEIIKIANSLLIDTGSYREHDNPEITCINIKDIYKLLF